MIIFTLKQYFYHNYKKWIISCVVLFGIAIMLRYIVPSDFLPVGEKLILWDYVFSSLSYPFATVFIIPLIYYYLIADIITKDYEGGYITFLLSRMSDRISYFISKAMVILIISNLFFLCYLIILISIALMFRLPIEGTSYYEVIKLTLESDKSTFLILAIQYGLFVMLLNFLGILSISISLIFNKSVYSALALIVFIIQGHNAVFSDHSKLMFSPIAQGLLSFHSPFCFYRNNVEVNGIIKNFTVTYSIKYLLFSIAILLIVGCLRVRTMNLYIKD